MRWMNSRCSFAPDERCVFFQKPCGSPCEMRIMNPSKPSIMHWDWLRRFWKACLAFCTAVAADCGDSWCKIFKTLCVSAVDMKCCQGVVTKNEPGKNSCHVAWAVGSVKHSCQDCQVRCKHKVSCRHFLWSKRVLGFVRGKKEARIRLGWMLGREFILISMNITVNPFWESQPNPEFHDLIGVFAGFIDSPSP